MAKKWYNNIGMSYAPTSKSFKPREISAHPMLLSRKHQIRDPTRPISFKSRVADYLLLQHITSSPDMFDVKGKKKSIDSPLKKDCNIWGDSLSNEICRLSQGIRNMKGNNAIIFIPKHKI